MGFLKRKKTSTQVTVEKITATKVVKLSYIESIIVSNNSSATAEFAGVSDPTEVNTSFSSGSKKDAKARFNETVGKTSNTALKVLGTIANNSVVALYNNIGSSLFGKKKSRDVLVNTKESGWTIVKSWAQPEFDVIRYAIAIKDLSVGQFLYEPVSEIVSIPWTSPKEIVKVYMIADQFIPSEFPPGEYIEYYIKPDIQDFKWIRINPMELPSQYTVEGNPVPRIISFNSERPISARLEESYITTTKPVKAIRVRIILKKPSSVGDSYTPVLRSYRLIMTPQGGL